MKFKTAVFLFEKSDFGGRIKYGGIKESLPCPFVLFSHMTSQKSLCPRAGYSTRKIEYTHHHIRTNTIPLLRDYERRNHPPPLRT